MNTARIRIGNQTNCNVPAKLPFEFAVINQFDAFEWFCDTGRAGWCEKFMSTSERSEIRRIAKKHNILFSVHAPWTADPTTPSGKKAILQSIRFGGDVNAGLVNIHIFPQHSAKLYVESLSPLVEAAEQAGLRLSIENTAQSSPECFNEVFSILSARPVEAGKIGMCLDMGHANLFPGTHNDYLLYVDRLGEHVPIIHWHAHENWGDRDSHLPLFTGPSANDDSGLRSLIKRLQKRKFTGSVVMEQWPDPPEILVYTRQRLLDLWNYK